MSPFGCSNHDARIHSRCYDCDGMGIARADRCDVNAAPCETCGGTGNEIGPPFFICHKIPKCPNEECRHYSEETGCDRK